MTHDTESLMISKDIVPPANLETEVFEKIEGVLEKENRRKKVFGFSFFFIFVCALIPVIIYMIVELQQSGLYNYSSLLFSDTGIIAGNAREFILSITDLIPFIPITIVLSVIFLLLLSIKYAVNVREHFLYKN
jgi:predicted nucleic acid-binding Zn ribbon protein